MVRELMRQPEWHGLPVQGTRSLLSGEPPAELAAKRTERACSSPTAMA